MVKARRNVLRVITRRPTKSGFPCARQSQSQKTCRLRTTAKPRPKKIRVRQLMSLVALGKQRWPGLTSAQRFARAFETNPALAKRAHRRPGPSTSFPHPTSKAMSLEPRVTSGGMDSFLDVDADAPRAYQELMKLVEQQRREGETEAASFERVFLDPANKTLALRALGQRAPAESSPPRQRQY